MQHISVSDIVVQRLVHLVIMIQENFIDCYFIYVRNRSVRRDIRPWVSSSQDS